MMCGTVVGEVREGRFAHHRECERPVRWLGKLPRCCHCGGSLYVDPALATPRFAGVEELRASSVLDL
jgi:hypothetical protein